MSCKKNVKLVDSVESKRDPKLLEDPTNLQPDSDNFVFPQTEVEQFLVTVWSELLRQPKVGPQDDFFKLGGHSLVAIDLIVKIYQQFQVELSVQKIYEFPTILSLAKEIESAVSNNPQAARTLEVRKLRKKLPVEGIIPLTPLQAWYLNQWDELIQPDRFNISRLFEVDDNFNFEILKQALTYLWKIHDVLRVRFVRHGVKWQQIIAGPDQIFPDYREYNLENTPIEIKETIIDEYAKLLQESINITHGPLIIIAYFNFGPQRSGRLMLIASHLLLDGNSITTLIKDLQIAYRQLREGNPIDLPEKSLSIKEWTELLHEYVLSDRHRQTIDYWLALPWGEVPDLPIDYPQNRGQNTFNSIAKITMPLTREETAILTRKIPLAINIEVENLLLWALTKVISEWTGNKLVEIVMVGNGHDLIPDHKYLDLSCTLGYLATHRVLMLESMVSVDLHQEIALFYEHIKKIPDNGYGYYLINAFNDDERITKLLKKVCKGEIFFNYRGLLDQVNNEKFNEFNLVHQSCGFGQNPRNKRFCTLAISGDIINYCLTFNWTYSYNLCRKETVEKLAGKFIRIIKDIISNFVS
jgi:non-ribosomal peptide synthase protein (TIGR01720 family)